MTQAAPPATNRTFVILDIVAVLCALLILAAFFLMPWLGVPDRAAAFLSFFKLPDFQFEGNPLFQQGLSAIALIPIAAIFVLVVAVRGLRIRYPNRHNAIGYVIGGILVLVFFNGFFVLLLLKQLQVSGQLVSDGAIYGIGFWVTLIAGVGLVLQVFRLLEGLRGKLVLGFTLVFTLVFALAYFWFYQFATEAALSRLVEDMSSTLDGLVAGVEGDAVAGLLAEVPATPDSYPTDERYWDHVNWFGTVMQIEPRAIAYSYTYENDQHNSIVYVGSVGATFSDPVGVKFKEGCASCEVSDNLQTLDSGEVSISTDINTDDFGSWITGNAPFFDADGNVVGAVGLDFEASSVLQVQQNILNSILLSFELAYIVLFGLVYLVAGALTDPLRKLSRSAKLVGEGQYEKANIAELKPSSRWQDEIDSLRVVFADMVQKVYKREETLKQQVKDLKIEIDQVKATREIKEIVESEFFENIAAKAKDIRARTARASSALDS